MNTKLLKTILFGFMMMLLGIFLLIWSELRGTFALIAFIVEVLGLIACISCIIDIEK